MNEPLRKKAEEIIAKNGRKAIFGGVKFHSQDTVIRSMIEFAKFYDKYERETDEEKKKDGNDTARPKCIICGEDYFTRCLCLKY